MRTLSLNSAKNDEQPGSEQMEQALNYPGFLEPANLGSASAVRSLWCEHEVTGPSAFHRANICVH